LHDLTRRHEAVHRDRSEIERTKYIVTPVTIGYRTPPVVIIDVNVQPDPGETYAERKMLEQFVLGAPIKRGQIYLIFSSLKINLSLYFHYPTYYMNVIPAEAGIQRLWSS